MRAIVEQPRHRLRSRRQRGAIGGAFSLIELVIVLLVIGIFAAAAVPRFVDSLLFHRVDSAARRVRADLELLRKTARLTSRAQTFEFTGPPDKAVYEAVAEDEDSEPDLKDLDRPSEPYSVQLWKPPYEIESATLETDGGDTRVSFDGFGVPTTVDAFGAHTAIDDRIDIRLRAGKFECVVSIDSLGEITRSDTVVP